MTRGKVIFLSAITVIGGTWLTRRLNIRKVPGFSPNG